MDMRKSRVLNKIRNGKTARKYGKMAGTVGGVGNYKDLENMGYNFINVGADVLGLTNYYKDIITKLK